MCINLSLFIDSLNFNVYLYVLCEDAKALAAEFSFCSFCWIKREANMVAHTLAKLDPQFNRTAIFFPKNLPPPVEVAWFRDFSSILSIA